MKILIPKFAARLLKLQPYGSLALAGPLTSLAQYSGGDKLRYQFKVVQFLVDHRRKCRHAI